MENSVKIYIAGSGKGKDYEHPTKDQWYILNAWKHVSKYELEFIDLQDLVMDTTSPQATAKMIEIINSLPAGSIVFHYTGFVWNGWTNRCHDLNIVIVDTYNRYPRHDVTRWLNAGAKGWISMAENGVSHFENALQRFLK